MNPNPSRSFPNALIQRQLFDEVYKRYLDEKEAHESEAFEEIRELDASCLPIANISAFTVFKNLRYLDLSFTEVNDLSPLAELPHLEELHLTFHRGVELDGLDKLTQINILDLSYPRHRIPGLDRVGYLENLEELYLNGCGLTTIAHTIPLEKLKVLTVSFNRIPAPERAAFRELYPECALLD